MDYTNQNRVLQIGKKYELVPLGETAIKPVTRIHRCFKPDKKQSTQMLDDSLPRFGPIYQQNCGIWQDAKKAAWKRVEYGVLGGVAAETKEKIFGDIRSVEKEAREAYSETFSGTRSEFHTMMIMDGCLFIQMTFMIFGVSRAELGYPLDDPVFGEKADITGWMEAMFYVGNQIPLVVLKELIKQNFFQDLIRKKPETSWALPKSDLRKSILYDQLISPEVKKLENTQHVVTVTEQPCDVLHALHILVIGPPSTDFSTNYMFEEYDGRFDFDLEANEEGRDEASKFPSATEMKKANIHIKKLKSGGPSNICFSSWYFWAYLYLPPLPVDAGIISVFRSLKSYEISDKRLGKHNREMSSYISLMSDIIRTPQDLTILRKKGIVGGNLYYAEKLQGTLRRLNSKDVKLTYNLSNVKHQIIKFSSPLIRYDLILYLVAVLTLVQAFFAVFAYFKPSA